MKILHKMRSNHKTTNLLPKGKHNKSKTAEDMKRTHYNSETGFAAMELFSLESKKKTRL